MLSLSVSGKIAQTSPRILILMRTDFRRSIYILKMYLIPCHFISRFWNALLRSFIYGKTVLDHVSWIFRGSVKRPAEPLRGGADEVVYLEREHFLVDAKEEGHGPCPRREAGHVAAHLLRVRPVVVLHPQVRLQQLHSLLVDRVLRERQQVVQEAPATHQLRRERTGLGRSVTGASLPALPLISWEGKGQG